MHGGPDADGVPAHDLSTNANACGPYPPALRALQAADARHYPDPAYTALTVQLAAWHGVAPSRIVVAASGSEFIQRISVAVALQARGKSGAAARVWLPAHAYGDYAHAARAAGLERTDVTADAALLWACDPSSPLGQPHAGLAEQVAALQGAQTLVLDQAYEPLRLDGALALDASAQDRVWRLLTPNKALGLTGVRAAYVIAPHDVDAPLLARVRALAPSWPLGAHGVALLESWASVDAHDWLDRCRATLRRWKTCQQAVLQEAGWRVEPSLANFVVAAPVDGTRVAAWPALLAGLRQHGFKLRDCASFGLPGHARLAVVAPAVQDALRSALDVVAAGSTVA
ncbi:MAG: aminotransferase class I/II-fold pyridoxal phosphate-dependent enzyme [Burkholderiales bacterium]|nr:aminotransferase class I/II-fold pyridoxal phosphate-dependent enzyme [Burkholderiales bacterium]MBK8666166.1 aminotransferase class I/II-fold pyridoxal phosphate-dependent enzyme [Burkholderiales bacterium]